VSARGFDPTHREKTRPDGSREQETPATVGLLHTYVVALSAREITTETIAEDWPDFFHLVNAFVVTYGSHELNAASGRIDDLWSVKRGTTAQPNLDQRRYLIRLAREMRRHLMSEPG
jgi:hypothetical protein